MEQTTIAVDMQSPLDLAIGSSSGAQKTEGNYCTICCTIPNTDRYLAESLTISSK